MSNTKPTIIWVPGAWHVPAHYAPVTSLLTRAGYKVVGVRTPSVRQTSPYPDSWTMDAGAVASAILTELDEGNEVVVVMHSYGGVPGSAAVQGLSKEGRASKGLQGGVVRLVYLTAMVLDVGESGYTMLELAPTLPGYKVRDPPEYTMDLENDIVHIKNPLLALYSGVDPELAADGIAKMQPFGLRVNAKPQEYAAWNDIPSAYIMCEDDQAITKAEQEYHSTRPGNKFTVYNLGHVGHSPFLECPGGTATVIEKAITGESA